MPTAKKNQQNSKP